MDRAQLQSILKAAQARLDADRDGELSRSGMPSALASLSLTLLEALADLDDPGEVSDLLGGLVSKEQRKALLTALRDPRFALGALAPATALSEACAALVNALGGAPKAVEPATVSQRMEAQTIANSNQYNVHGDQHIYEAPVDPAVARAERALNDYLSAARHVCNTVQLARLDRKDAGHRDEMRLERVYIGLNTTRQVELSQEELQQLDQQERRRLGERPLRALTTLETIGGGTLARLMLLGGPGSGKSTFVNHLALCLAGARLGERVDAEAERGQALLARLAPHWKRGALLPVRIVLRELAAFPQVADPTQGTLAVLRAFLAETMAPHGDALDLVLADLSAGRAVLLFDGLDEVVGDQILARVVACIADAAGTYSRCPVLVTCRELDYEANPLRQVRGFSVERLASLDDAQIDQFIAAWHAEVAATGRQMLGTAPGLRQALAGRPDLREMARQPLLLTMMAIVHAGKGRLPDARALLYSECIELLLLRWRQPRGEPDLLARLGLSQFRSSDLLALMARLGFAAHEQAAPDEAQPRPTDLDEGQLITLLAKEFARYDRARRYDLAQTVLDALAERNGLLLKRGPGRFSFPHRTFQEFLAGYHLTGQQREYHKLCLERAGKPHWHEALSLMVGYQVLEDRELERPLDLAAKLLGRGPLEQALAGELLSLIGAERAASYDPAVLAPGGLWERARDVLLRLSTQGKAPEAPAPLRARAGMALGRVCYGDVALAARGAAPALADPRLLDPERGNAPDGRYWCPVDAGPFWYGDDREGKLKRVSLDYDFRIARYPVTNAEFARFIAAGGYERREWWTDEGWKYIEPGGFRFEDEPERITMPRFWDDPGLNNPLQPVVGVSWYEAAAYCRWLTDLGLKAGWLPAATEIRLPT